MPIMAYPCRASSAPSCLGVNMSDGTSPTNLVAAVAAPAPESGFPSASSSHLSQHAWDMQQGHWTAVQHMPSRMLKPGTEDSDEDQTGGWKGKGKQNITGTVASAPAVCQKTADAGQGELQSVGEWDGPTYLGPRRA
jgi:hypothetical protein